MSNALTVLDQGPPALPAELAEQFDENSNLPDRASVPSLSYKGKVWSIFMNGEETKIQGKNAEGDLVPVQVMRVIILDWAKVRGRAYYPGAYDPAKTAMPDCWSDDGIKPSEHVTAKQCDTCAACPMAVKGSKTTDNGTMVAACQQHRMLAVVPAAKPLDFPPLRLKIAVTSDYDGKSPDHEANGWFAFRGYTDVLKARNVKHTALLVTKMKFDTNVAWPKVLFSPDKWVDPATVEALMPTILSEEVKGLISGSWTPNGVDGVAAKPAAAEEPEEPAEVEEVEEAPAPPPKAAPKAAPVAAKPAAAPKATPVAAKPAAAPKAAPKAAAPPAEEDEVQEEWIAPGSPEPVKPAPKATAVQQPGKPQAATAKPVSAKPKAPAAAPAENPQEDAELAGLLDEWDA